MQIVDRVRELGGYARSREVTRSSTDRRRLADALASGRLRRVRAGVVALPAAAEPAAVALACGGALTCISALQVLRLPLLVAPGTPHVAVPSHRGRSVASRGVELHWTEHPVRDREPLPLSLVLAHARRCLLRDEWVAAVDAALQRRMLRLHDLEARRPVAGRVGFDLALRSVDGRSGSLPESLLRLAMVRHGLRFVPQAHLPGLGRVDFLVEDVVVVEVDGLAYHGDRGQFREDRRRDRVAHRAGLVVARFTFEDAVRRADDAAAEVVALVAARRGVPT